MRELGKFGIVKRRIVSEYPIRVEYELTVLGKAFESPPLWVWAIIVGVLLASKFIYGWRVTKELADESYERHERIERTKD